MSDPAIAAARWSLSDDSPWPGLLGFGEADGKYFRGRDSEKAELLERVERHTLTVLFGRSGLGKSSLLRAGLFPLLPERGLLPVYVRLDHAAAAPALSAQMLTRLVEAGQAAGALLPPIDVDDPLWSAFHRRSAEFWSARNRPLVPVLVLDQFEEIFTEGRASPAATERSVAFLEGLADLVENRAPTLVREAIEADPALASRWEFRRASVKLVISFREDFLAEFESLKTAMPAIMGNRLRLLPMDGAQAFAVVAGAGEAVVDADTARRILRLAWKNEVGDPVDPAEFAQVEIDPAILSVVCSELNRKRLEAPPPRGPIRSELLSGADREILAAFYERTMASVDPRVRAFVENELLTDRGFRDSFDAEDALSVDGVTPATLELLVNGRLLRTEERQGRRRLELAHDVLTRVVMASRDKRRSEEADAELRRREAAAAATQRRNRIVGMAVAIGFVAAVGAGIAAVFAWQRADREAAIASQAVVLAAAATTKARAEEANAAGAVRRAEAAASNALALEKQAHAAAAAASQAQAKALEQEKRAQEAEERARLSAAAASSARAEVAQLQRRLFEQSLRTAPVEQQLASRLAAVPPPASSTPPPPPAGTAKSPPVTTEELARIMPRAGEPGIDRWLAALNAAMVEFDITTPLRRAAFLAQIAHESGSLVYAQELWGPTATQLRYEPPSEIAARLGNTEAGDGQRYRGRGLIQLVGRRNYAQMGRDLGVDLEGKPDLALEPAVAARIAGRLWQRQNLNVLADAGEFQQITRRLNGGLNGIAGRTEFYERAKRVLGATR